MTNLIKSSICFALLCFFLSASSVHVFAESESEELYSGAIDAVDFVNRLVIIGDLPLMLTDKTTVLSREKRKLSRYTLTVGQKVKVEYDYNPKIDREVARVIYLQQ